MHFAMRMLLVSALMGWLVVGGCTTRVNKPSAIAKRNGPPIADPAIDRMTWSWWPGYKSLDGILTLRSDGTYKVVTIIYPLGGNGGERQGTWSVISARDQLIVLDGRTVGFLCLYKDAKKGSFEDGIGAGVVPPAPATLPTSIEEWYTLIKDPLAVRLLKDRREESKDLSHLLTPPNP